MTEEALHSEGVTLLVWSISQRKCGSTSKAFRLHVESCIHALEECLLVYLKVDRCCVSVAWLWRNAGCLRQSWSKGWVMNEVCEKHCMDHALGSVCPDDV